MTNLFHYSLVRCVPEPRTGEFINIGAIAGSAALASWDVRQIQNERRAARICNKTQLGAVHEFLASVAAQIEHAEEADEPLPGDWLDTLHAEMRNVVQLSAPQMAVHSDVSTVLDVVFERMLIDPEKTARSYISKTTLLASLRRALRSRIASGSLLEKPEVHVGGHLRSNLDFAVAKSGALQLTQAWSFQKDSVEDVATEVKSWGYALQRLRDGEESRIVSRTGDILNVSRDVEIDILLAPPTTPQQSEIFEEAQEVFNDVGVTTYSDDAADALGDRVLELMAA